MALRRRLCAYAVILGGLFATAVMLGTGGQAGPQARAPVASAPSAAAGYQRDAARRTGSGSVSRDAVRPSLGDLKQQALRGRTGTVGRHRGGATVKTGELAAAHSDPRDIARAMLAQYGWSEYEFGCLDSLWVGESNWNPSATNPTSGAYGIPQSLPAEKMASAGPDWRTNPATQIAWGLEYIRLSYGTPCSANSFKAGNGWY